LSKIAYQLSALLLRSQEVSGSVLGLKTGCNDRGKFMGVSQTNHAKSVILQNPEIRQRPFPCAF